MDKTYLVRCPNCGDFATRSHFTSEESRYTSCYDNQILQTECSHCDYLMVTCSSNGNVIEAHSSSTSFMTKDSNNHDCDPVISWLSKSPA